MLSWMTTLLIYFSFIFCTLQQRQHFLPCYVKCLLTPARQGLFVIFFSHLAVAHPPTFLEYCTYVTLCQVAQINTTEKGKWQIQAVFYYRSMKQSIAFKNLSLGVYKG